MSKIKVVRSLRYSGYLTNTWCVCQVAGISKRSDDFYFWHPMLLIELISISNMGVSLIKTCFCSRLYGISIAPSYRKQHSNRCHKVASSNASHLEAHMCRLFQIAYQGNFWSLWTTTFWQKVDFLTCIRTPNYTVFKIQNVQTDELLRTLLSIE